MSDSQTGELVVADRPSLEEKSDFLYKYRNLIHLLSYIETGFHNGKPSDKAESSAKI